MHPAFFFVDGALLFDGVGQRLRIERHLLVQRHAVTVVVLLEAGIHWDPAIALAMVRATARVEVHPGFHPNMFQPEAVDAAATGHCDIRDTALAEQIAGRARRVDTTHPVHYLVRGYFHGTHGVARRYVRGAQQRDQQAGGVEGVTATVFQRVFRALDGAVAGNELDVIAHPLVERHGLVIQFLRQCFDGRRDIRVQGTRQMLLVGGHRAFQQDAVHGRR